MKLGSIQCLRAVAVVLLVYLYAIDLAPDYARSQQYQFFYLKTWGNMGIDLFCVISGFVMFYTANALKGREEGWRFLKSRFRRINPLFYLASIIFFISQYLLLWAVKSPNMFLLNSKLASGFIDTVWIIPTSRSMMEYRLYLPIGWFLALAWLFSLLVYMAIVMKSNRKLLLLSIFIIVLVIAGYMLNPKDFRLQFLSHPMLLEFLLGFMIGHIYRRVNKVSPVMAGALVLAGLAMMVLPVFLNYGEITDGGNSGEAAVLLLKRVLLLGFPCSCLVAGCVLLEKNGNGNIFWNNRVGRVVGNASYSIFLSQAILFTLLSIVYYRSKYLLLPDLAIPVQLVLAISFGIVVHKWVEKPLLKWMARPKHTRSKSIVAQQLPQST